MSRLLRTVVTRMIRNNNGMCGPYCEYTSLPTNSELSRQPQDLVMQTLRSSQSSDELLNAVSRHLQVMNQKHLMQVLRSLFDLHKDKRSHGNIHNILRDPTFGAMCQAIKRHARTLELNECVEALKILSFLKVPVDTVLVQTVLQLIRKNINEFSMRQIIFIDFIISKYDISNPLLDALKMALPLVFQIHLPLELDHEDLPQLKEMLSYACSRELPDRCINNIVTGLLLHGEDIDYKTARSIAWSLVSVNMKEDFHETKWKLLQICFKIVARNIESYDIDNVMKLAGKLMWRLQDKHMECYNEELFDAFANFTIQKNLNVEQALQMTRYIAKANHTNMPFVEHIFNLAHENLDYVEKAPPSIVLDFVKCLSNANCKLDPQKWNDIRERISRNDVTELKNLRMPYTKFLVELASLGHYDFNLLSKFYNADFLASYLNREGVLDHMQILIVHEAAKLFSEGYDLSPPEEVLKKAYDSYSVHSDNLLLGEPLAFGLGNKEHYATNIQLPSGIIVDHIIALQDGRPIQITGVNKEGKTSLEQLNLPASAVIVCLVKFNKGCYSINNDRLRGQYRLILDVLEAQGYPAVPVNVNTWIQTPEDERSPYLVREIEYKCAEMGLNLVLNS